MRILVDITEPGQLFGEVQRRGQAAGITVQRTILHRRRRMPATKDKHAFAGSGSDYLIVDAEAQPAIAIERKTTEDLAKRILQQDAEKGKLFRQLTDFRAHPFPVLLAEGNPTPLYRRVEAVATGIQFWCARQGIALVWTTGPIASAVAIVQMARKIGAELDEPKLALERLDPDERARAP